ncbi:hypothetical protein G4O51_11520 [Candidatus Bathyarchaeota archaeon A05DMB-2]|nr:hypothetical protein [Candidatus Bathyarchaeota archaeon A05DMB-2]
MKTVVDFRKYKYLSILLALLCAVSALLATANLLETDVTGTGKSYIQHDFVQSGDIASTKNGSIVYKYSAEWDTNVRNTKSVFVVQGARGTYEDQYVVWGSAAGEVVEYRITKLFGEFQGSQDTKIVVVPGEDEQFVNLILVRGNASYEGRVRAFDKKGHPLDQETLFAIGDYALRNYINISKPIEKPEDWLGFCDEIERGLVV